MVKNLSVDSWLVVGTIKQVLCGTPETLRLSPNVDDHGGIAAANDVRYCESHPIIVLKHAETIPLKRDDHFHQQ